jgi:hypothetical protein
MVKDVYVAPSGHECPVIMDLVRNVQQDQPTNR